MARLRMKGAVALVTGAAKGIGRGTALALAKKGVNLALLDRLESELKQTKAEVEALGVKASMHVVDMTDAAAIDAVPAEVEAAHGKLNILMNNAGVSLTGDFDQVSLEDIDWVMDVNFRSVLRLTRVCMPLLRAAPEAQIVNVSSMFAIFTPPGQGAYSASKYAIRGFSNVLRYELRGTNVGVTVLHPGGIATDIISGGRLGKGVTNSQVASINDSAKKGLVMPPERAGELIARAIEKRVPRRMIGIDAKLFTLLERLFPVTNYEWIEFLFPSARKARAEYPSASNPSKQ